MLYKHLSENERIIIYFSFYIKNESISQIAKDLNRNKSTISRELKRNLNSFGLYNPSYAQRKYRRRKRNTHIFCMLKYKSFTDLFLEKFNKRSFGVEATCNYIKKNYPCVKVPSARQVFNWIKLKRWVIVRSDCLRRKYVKGKRRKNGMYSKLKNKYVLPITLRPESINKREKFGHWEVDLVMSKRQKGYSHLLTMTERVTRKTFIKLVKGKHPFTINSAIKKITEENKLVVKTITVDNGIEFSSIGILAHWIKCKIYYCQPYSSFQRGSNENANGLIRRWYKKGFDFSLLSENDIKNLEFKINSIPRRMFNFLSSNDVFKQY
ncbi:MAG: IS30 family transposase [Malacoplasma sp.]|nr:IS30 family transposase [Malacoplasma sp.]MDE6563091.1 IS30 family transposase [Malacoplasma sp.]